MERLYLFLYPSTRISTSIFELADLVSLSAWVYAQLLSRQTRVAVLYSLTDLLLSRSKYVCILVIDFHRDHLPISKKVCQSIGTPWKRFPRHVPQHNKKTWCSFPTARVSQLPRSLLRLFSQQVSYVSSSHNPHDPSSRSFSVRPLAVRNPEAKTQSGRGIPSPYLCRVEWPGHIVVHSANPKYIFLIRPCTLSHNTQFLVSSNTRRRTRRVLPHQPCVVIVSSGLVVSVPLLPNPVWLCTVWSDSKRFASFLHLSRFLPVSSRSDPERKCPWTDGGIAVDSVCNHSDFVSVRRFLYPSRWCWCGAWRVSQYCKFYCTWL